MQLLNEVVREQNEHQWKSHGARLKLLDSTPLQKPVTINGAQAAFAKVSMQMAEKLPSQQTHRVVNDARALPRSIIGLLFCGDCAFHSMQ